MQESQVPKKQLQAAMALVAALGSAVQEAGSIPSGHLYVALMADLSLDNYQAALRILVNAKLVREDRSHMLTWIGPEKGGINA